MSGGGYTTGLHIRMVRTVRPERPFEFGRPNMSGMVAQAGHEYDAESNTYGAISVVFADGEKLGVKPGEFEFVVAPQWVRDIHAQVAKRGQ